MRAEFRALRFGAGRRGAEKVFFLNPSAKGIVGKVCTGVTGAVVINLPADISKNCGGEDFLAKGAIKKSFLALETHFQHGSHAI
jgi:hypothetical protein